MASAPVFISVVKREFRHSYTAATKAAVLEEAQELIRTVCLLIDISVRPSNLREPGSISFEIEEAPGEYIVRVRGVPRLVVHAITVFGRVDGWTEERRRVAMVLATEIRTIPHNKSKLYLAESARANAGRRRPVSTAAATALPIFTRDKPNRPGNSLKDGDTPVPARRSDLEIFAEERGLSISIAGPVMRQWNNVVKNLKSQGYSQRHAEAAADGLIPEFIRRATK